MIFAETYTGLLTDRAHFLFELTWESVTGLLVFLAGRWLLPKIKDRWHTEIDASHGVQHAETGAAYSVDEILTANQTLAAAYREAVALVAKQNEAFKTLRDDHARLQGLLADEMRRNR